MKARTPVWLLAGLLLAPACGIGPEGDAHVIRSEDVPYGLLEEAEPGAPSTVPDGTSVPIYLVDDGRLVEVGREVPPDAELLEILRLLAAGATGQEEARGLTSSVAEPEAYREVHVVRGVAEVDLGEPFSDLDATGQAQAIAQTVFTLTARPGVGRVRFTLEGTSVEVPRGDGTLTGDALARDDFPDLLAPG